MSMTRNEFLQETVIRMAAGMIVRHYNVTDSQAQTICEAAERVAKEFESAGGHYYFDPERGKT